MSSVNVRDAIALLDAGRTAEAALFLEKVVAAYPGYAPGLVLLARAYEAERRWDAALRVWHQARFFVPNSPVPVHGVRRVAPKVVAEPAPRTAARSGDERTAPPAGVAPSERQAEEKEDLDARVQQVMARYEEEAGRDQDVEAAPPVADAPSPAAVGGGEEPVRGAFAEPEASDEGPVQAPPRDAAAAPPPPAPIALGRASRPSSTTRPSKPEPHDEPVPPPPPSSPPPPRQEETLPPHVTGDLTEQEPSRQGADVTRVPPSVASFEELDQLINELESAKIVPRPDVDTIPPPNLEDDIDDVVSETLARIYAAQEQFGEAARIYEVLAEQQPGRSTFFLQKATEMRLRTKEQ